MSKRGYGYELFKTIQEDEFSRKYPGMDDPDGCRKGINDYMRDGKLREGQFSWAGRLIERYQIFRRRTGRPPYSVSPRFLSQLEKRNIEVNEVMRGTDPRAVRAA